MSVDSPPVPQRAAVPGRTALPPVTWLLAAGTFLMGTTEFVVAGLLPQVASSLGTDLPGAGLAITAFAVGMIVGAPTMPLLTLRLPHRTTLAAALLVFAAGHVLGAVTGSLGVLLASRALTGLATGTFWAVACVAAVAAAGPAAASRVLGIVLGGGMLANVLGVPLGTIAGQAVGWRGTFVGLAVLAAVLTVAVLRGLPRAGSGPSARPSLREELASLRSVRLWLVLLTCAFITAGVLSTYSYVAPLVTDAAGLSASLVPGLLLVFGVASLAGNVLGGRLGDARPLATVGGVLVATAVVAVLLAALSSRPVAVPVLFALLGLVGLSANPVLVGLANAIGGGSTLATAMPTAIFNLGTAIGTALAGAAFAGGAGVQGPLLVGAVAALLAPVPFAALALRDRRRSQPRSRSSTGTSSGVKPSTCP